MGKARLFAAAVLVPLFGTACRTSILYPVAGSCVLPLASP